LGCETANSVLLCGDGPKCDAESAFAIGEPDLGRLAALLRFA